MNYENRNKITKMISRKFEEIPFEKLIKISEDPIV